MAQLHVVTALTLVTALRMKPKAEARYLEKPSPLRPSAVIKSRHRPPRLEFRIRLQNSQCKLHDLGAHCLGPRTKSRDRLVDCAHKSWMNVSLLGAQVHRLSETVEQGREELINSAQRVVAEFSIQILMASCDASRRLCSW